MEIVIAPDPLAAADIAADAIARLLNTNPNPVLGLATGSSPIPIYDNLIERFQNGALSFATCRAFLLDEYVGLAADHPEAYRSYIRRLFTDHIDLPPGALFGPDGYAADLSNAAMEYERLITEAGGIDLQILGIGGDGHIGFNEPASSLGSRTRLKTLNEATRRDNARFFDHDINAVPHHVLTQGIGTILDAGHLILIATGESKALPVARAVEGPLTAMVPASALQLHPHVTIVLDEPAAQDLSQIEYYREAYANKPQWQHI
ncbi:MAG: glucosamine-6-phosphate deaminase [Acidimicrobiales bacterium]